MMNPDLPITESNGTELGFELGSVLDPSAVVEPGSEMPYDLNLQQTRKNGEDGKQSGAGISGGGGVNDGQRSRPVSLDAVALQKLKDHMKRLPEAEGFEEFKDVSVEDFGAALLARYGCREGMGIGKNAR